MDDAPTGPSAEEEAAMLAADRSPEEYDGQLPKAAALEPVTGEAPLPPMEDLVNRIPAPARTLLDDLFRARFVTVKRVPRSALKN